MSKEVSKCTIPTFQSNIYYQNVNEYVITLKQIDSRLMKHILDKEFIRNKNSSICKSSFLQTAEFEVILEKINEFCAD